MMEAPNIPEVWTDSEDSDNSSTSSVEFSDSEFFTEEDDDGDDSGDESEHEYADTTQHYRFRLYHFQEEGPFSCAVPQPRSGHRIIYFNGCIYSFGGYNPHLPATHPDMTSDEFWAQSKPLFKELWKFNLGTKQWTKIKMTGEIPNQLASHATVLHPAMRGVMLVYGGTGSPFGEVLTNQVTACKLETGHFTKINISQTDSSPKSLYGQAVCLDSDSIMYTVGGTSGLNYYIDVHRMDLFKRPPVWEALAVDITDDAPRSRYRHEICAYNNKLFVLGGGTSEEVFPLEVIPTFCLQTLKWSMSRSRPNEATLNDQAISGYPEARRCHGIVQLGEMVYVIGGYNRDEIFGVVWRLELSTLQWTKMPMRLKVPVYFHANTISEDGKMIVFGGIHKVYKNLRTNRLYTCWLKIPKLKAMALEAVLYYAPKIQELGADKLIQMGLPRDTVQSIFPLLASCG